MLICNIIDKKSAIFTSSSWCAISHSTARVRQVQSPFPLWAVLRGQKSSRFTNIEVLIGSLQLLDLLFLLYWTLNPCRHYLRGIFFRSCPISLQGTNYVCIVTYIRAWHTACMQTSDAKGTKHHLCEKWNIKWRLSVHSIQ